MKTKIIPLLIFVSVVSGCATIKETAKVFWGSSTKVLEEARINALSNVYQCTYEDCYREVLQISQLEEYKVLIKDKTKGHIVFINIKGAVDTTEVGVFFEKVKENETQVDISSLSSNAKTIVAGVVFPQLEQVYPKKSQTN